MVRHPTYNQIINFHRTFAYLRTVSNQNSSCDTNKCFIVDFVKGVKAFGSLAPPEPAGEFTTLPTSPSWI